MIGLRPLLGAASLSLALCGTAHAATVSTSQVPRPRHCPTPGDECVDSEPARAVTFTASPGETNDVTITATPREGGYTIRETGAPLEAKGECSLVEPGVAKCPPTTVYERFTVELGDGDDRASSEQDMLLVGGPGNDALTDTTLRSDLEGGSGDDTLTGRRLLGGPGADRLTMAASSSTLFDPNSHARGGAGDDVLIGSPGGETVSGGGGTDRIEAGGGDDMLSDGDTDESADEDVLDGGPGKDGVSYATRREPVRVDLSDAGPDGAAGEGDHLIDVEDVEAGAGDDVLIGSEAPNALSSLAGGADRYEGRGGDDTISDRGGGFVADGGTGNDTISGYTIPENLVEDPTTTMIGGPGDDDLGSDDPWARLSCGDGSDLVSTAPVRRLVPPDCETAGVSVLISLRSVRLVGNRLSFRARGVRGGLDSAHNPATVFSLDKVFARRPTSGRLGRTRPRNISTTRFVTVRMTLGPAAVRFIRRRPVRLTVTSESGPEWVVLRLPRR